MEDGRKIKCKAYSTVIGSFIYMMGIGSVYVTGVISTYIKSYYKLPTDSNIVADLLPAVLFVNMLILPVGSYLVQIGWKPRTLILMGAGVTYPCFYTASFMDKFWAFAMLYVIGFSWSQGLIYMAPVHHGWLWFPNNPGLVSGIILGGFGFGALVFDNVITHVINPENLPINPDTGYYPDSVNNRFIFMWRVLVTCWLGISIIGFVMIFPGPEKTKTERSETESSINESIDHDLDINLKKDEISIINKTDDTDRGSGKDSATTTKTFLQT